MIMKNLIRTGKVIRISLFLSIFLLSLSALHAQDYIIKGMCFVLVPDNNTCNYFNLGFEKKL